MPLISDGLERRSGVFQNKSGSNNGLVQWTSGVWIVKEKLESRLPMVGSRVEQRYRLRTEVWLLPDEVWSRRVTRVDYWEVEAEM